MATIDPATGEWIYDENEEPGTGMVGQQEDSAANAPDIMPPAPEQPPPEAPAPPYSFEPTPVYLPGQEPGPETGGFEPSPVYLPGEGPVGDMGFEPDPVYLPGQEPQDPNGLMEPDLGEPEGVAKKATGGAEEPVAVGAPESEAPPPGDLQLPEPQLALPSKDAGGPGAPMLTPPNLQLAEPGIGNIPTDGTPGAPDVRPPGEAPTDAGAPKSLVDQRIAERQAQGEIETKNARARAEMDSHIADLKAKAEQDAKDIIKRGQDDLARNRIQQQEDYAKYRAIGEKDVWGDNPTRNKILAGIAMILGGRSAGHFIIGAVNGLEEKKKTELAMAEKKMKMDGDDAKDIRESTTQQLADWNTRKAAGLDSMVARTEAELSANGMSAPEIAANKDIIAIKQAAMDARKKADDLQHAQAEKKIKDDLANRKTNSEIELINARVNALRNKGKGGGGGGGDAMSKFVAAANALQPGETIPPEVAELGLKAHLKPNQIAAEVDRYRGSGAKAETAEGRAAKTGESGAIDASFKPFRTEAIGSARSIGPVRQLEQIEQMKKTLDEAVASGDPARIKAAAVKAQEQAGTLMSGGKMTVGQQKILETMKSSIDHATESIGKWTGDPVEGKGFIKRLSAVIDGAGQETLNQVKAIRERAMNQHLGPGGAADTPEKKRAFLNQLNGTFSSVKWQGQPAFEEGRQSQARQQPAAADGAAPKNNPPSGVLPIATPKDKALYIKAKGTQPGDPFYDTAQEWLRKHGKL